MNRSIFLIFPALILLFCGTALTKDVNKTGCVKGDCDNGKGTYVWSNGDTYTGDFKKGKFNGTGTLKFADGSIYTGDWKNDIRKGSGILFYSNGDEYEGEFSDNVPHGKGKYTYADGSIEKGIFFNHLFTGQIRLPEAGDQKKITVSKVVEIKPTDFEITIADTGSLKTGDKLFVEVNGTMCALKIISRENSAFRCKMIGGTRFLIFQMNKELPVYRTMNGIKKDSNSFLFPNGNKYVGEFKGNMMHGKGEFTWTNGSKYTGEFKNGMRNGKGMLKTYDGAVYTGEFKNGFYDGIGIYTGSGQTYEGQWKKGLKNGTGKISAGGDIYEGEFKDDRLEGKGTYKFSYGDKYVGEFKGNMMHGNGVLYKYDGTVYQEGRWMLGIFMGK